MTKSFESVSVSVDACDKVETTRSAVGFLRDAWFCRLVREASEHSAVYTVYFR